MTDRHINEITYVRRPYEEQSYFEEFLLVLRNGPIDADCDPPLLLWSRSNGPPSTAPGEAYAPH